jgi:hypothetical protein
MPRKVKINSSSIKASIPTEVGVRAAELAARVAMHIYGFTRATTDVDLLASEKLPLKSKRKLTFGGESYRIKVGRREVQVDAIVRNDQLSAVYQAALANALETDAEVDIVSPEWMAILKYFAGRAKDKLDLIWLLQQDGLVDRKQVQKNLVKAIGKQSAYFVFEEIKSEFDYADFLKVREKSK